MLRTFSLILAICALIFALVVITVRPATSTSNPLSTNFAFLLIGVSLVYIPVILYLKSEEEEEETRELETAPESNAS